MKSIEFAAVIESNVYFLAFEENLEFKAAVDSSL